MTIEYTLAVTALLYIAGWFALTLLVRCLHRSPRQSRLVWCAAMKCFSLVELESGLQGKKTRRVVRRCLLWPELHDCAQRCVN